MVHLRLIIKGYNVSAQCLKADFDCKVPGAGGPYPLNVVESYKDTLDLLSRLVRQGTFSGKGNEKDLQILGANLYDILFGHQLNKLGDFFKELVYIKEQEIKLGLVFEPNSEFISWPWELLFSKSSTPNGEFLISRDNIQFYRALDDDEDFSKIMPRIDDSELRILLVAAGPHEKLTLVPKNPENEQELKKSRIAPLNSSEIKKIKLQLNDLRERSLKNNLKIKVDFLTEEDLNKDLANKDFSNDYFDDQKITYQVSHDNFIAKLNAYNPDVLHIIAHGYNTENGGEIAFIQGRDIVWEQEKDFLSGYKDTNRRLRFVFLQTCDSALPGQFNKGAGLGLRVYKSKIHSVIAMQSKIEQADAFAFSTAFYDNLITKQNEIAPLEEAYKISRELINKNSFFGIPVLYTRSEIEWNYGMTGKTGGVGGIVREPGPSITGSSVKKCIWCEKDIPSGWKMCVFCKGTIICTNETEKNGVKCQCLEPIPAELPGTGFNKCPFCTGEISIGKIKQVIV